MPFRIPMFLTFVLVLSLTLGCNEKKESSGGGQRVVIQDDALTLLEFFASLGSTKVSLLGSPQPALRFRLTGDTYTRATNCPGTNTGGYCSLAYQIKVTFAEPFAAPPIVHVSPANISDHGADIRGTMDSVVASAQDITATGFTLVCSGSPNPYSSSSGPYEGQFSIGRCSWTALGLTTATSGPDVLYEDLRVFSRDTTGNTCSGQYLGGYCLGGYYYRDITFDHEFAAPPKVVVAPRLVSDQSGSVGYATDKIISYASDITTSGARIWCSGSQVGVLGVTPYETAGTIGTCNVLALGEAAGSPSESDIPQTQLLAQRGSMIEASNCSGDWLGTYCNRPFYKDIVFAESFATPPTVQVAIAHSSHDGNAGMATDQVSGYATNVTASGFRLWCSGSPINGALNGSYVRSACNWEAVGSL